jgi:hypothetical protein
MGYQPRIKSPRDTSYEYRKPLREKGKNRKGSHRRLGRPVQEEKPVITEREVSEGTLKRLHTLGAQKFGSSPYSEHFNRWLTNVEAVLCEFEAHPSISIDEQFRSECAQALSTIRLQLEERRRKEAAAEQEMKNLEYCRSLLKQVNIEYSAALSTAKARKNSEIKRLNSIIAQLKSEQDKVIRMKTGFFRGISKKEREQKELAIVQALNDRQTELELAMLNFSTQQKELREQYERKREPVQKQIKTFQKKVQEAETDGSLEERWFACEALVDAVNGFLQRKAAGSFDSKGLEPQNGGA